MKKIFLLLLLIPQLIIAASYTTNVIFTVEGGVGCLMRNMTGTNTTKVFVSASTQNSTNDRFIWFDVYNTNSKPLGVVYKEGVSNGQLCVVIFGGIVDVLMESNTYTTNANWVYVITNGRVNASYK